MTADSKRIIKCAVWSILYLAWVIWLGNYWWLLGLIVIFDLYITRKVRWAFWRPKDKSRKNVLLEWLDAIIWALVVATFLRIFFIEAYKIPSSSMEKTLMTGDYLFVSKLAYGPKMPETPVSVPLVHNVMPVTGGKSYSEIISLPYRRLAGLSEVKRNDIVVFAFPNGDTVLSKAPAADYHEMVRLYGKESAERAYGPITVRPRDKKDNYVKRCVAVAGDTLQIIDGRVHVNGMPQPEYEGIQNTYTVITNGTPVNPRILEEMSVNLGETSYSTQLPGYTGIPLDSASLVKMKSLPNVVDVKPNFQTYDEGFPLDRFRIFPYSTDYRWTRDNFGPLWIPSRGASVELDLRNLPLYSRIISVYEGNDLQVKDGEIFINGEKATSYTFRQNYYFMMGDNRHNSADSRYWGFVPEDHVVGKPVVVWFSSDKDRSFPSNIRWNRILKFV